ATRLQLAPDDAEVLARVLPRLPGKGEEDEPITLDLDGQAVIRAKAQDQKEPTELILSRSTVSGPAVRFRSNRQYLARAVGLGFTEISVLKPERPIVCREQGGMYLWMPLGPTGALPPSPNSVRLNTSEETAPQVQTQAERSTD